MRIGWNVSKVGWRHLAVLAVAAVLTLRTGPAWAGLAEECSALFERGTQYYRKGDYPHAVAALERAARIAESAFGIDNTNVSLVYNALSNAYLAQQRYNDAEPFLLRALQIREHNVGPSSSDLVPVLSNTALLYDNQGRYVEAEAYYKRALGIEEASVGPDHPNVGLTLVNLANLYQHAGRYAEAEAAYLRALAIAERAFGPEHPNLLFVIDNLAALYGNWGHNDEATRLLQRSLAIKEKALGGTHAAIAPTLTAIAGLYDRDGRFADAEALYQRVLAINEGIHDDAGIGASLNNLAAFYRARNRLAEAEPLYRRALAVQQKAHGPNHPEVAVVLSNLAVLYDKENRAAEAEPLDRRALAIDQAALGPESDAAAADMYALGLLYDHLGRATEAEALLTRALSIRERAAVFNPGNVALSQSGLARLYEGQNRTDEAVAAGRKALALWSGGGVSSADSLAAGYNGPAAVERDFRAEMVRILYQAYARSPQTSQPLLDEAFRAAQSARDAATAQALAGMTARHTAGSEALSALVREQQDLAARAQALNAAVIKVMSQPPSQRSPAAEARLRAEQLEVEARLKADNIRLHTEFPRYVELAHAENVGVARVQQVLAADEALVTITLGETDSYLFAIRKDRAAFYKLALSRAQAADAVRALRASLADDTPFPLDKAHDLHTRLLGPADGLIADAKTLLIVPDGALESLPFSLLVTAPIAPSAGNDPDYRRVAWLIRRQALTTLPAASSLVSLRSAAAAPRATQPFVGFGNPDFHGDGARRGIDTMSLYEGSQGIADRLRKLPSLPETADELRVEARTLGAPDTSLHLGGDASVTTVTSLDLSNVRVLAFATHAGVAGEIAGVAEPALVLTPPPHPTAGDDGLLRASQVSQLRLNADFVILSACNTAAPDGTPGAEGLSGLAKAFFYAGARSLLVSHWEVQSGPTVKLTTGLIRALAADPAIGRSEALRRSILAMIEGADPAETHPVAWAPFVLAGEGGPER